MSPEEKVTWSNGTANTATSTTTTTFHSQQKKQKQEESSSSISGRCNSSFYYLSSKAVTNLPNFKYSGADLSLLYQYVLSPLAQWMVDHVTPNTIAPNCITMFGLSLMLVSYNIYSHYNPNLEYYPDNPKQVQEQQDHDESYALPRWMFLVNGCAMLLYQTLDNMDGKQARKTGSSSPLGLLFDHGCDAVNSMFGSANWIIAMGLQPILWQDQLCIWILLIFPMMLFYIATWEEYFTGSLILPIINGPSEGLFGGAILSMTTALVGVSYWQTTSWYDAFLGHWMSSFIGPLRNADIMVGIATILCIREMIFKTTLVFTRYGWVALYNLIPMMIIATLSFYIGYMEDQIWIRLPRTTLWLISGLFTEIVTQLMLDHITDETYQPFQRWVLLPLVGLAIAVTWMDTTNEEGMYDDFILMYTSSLWSYLIMKMTVVIHEICVVLNIWCFDIVTPRQQSQVLVQQQQVYANGKKHQ